MKLLEGLSKSSGGGVVGFLQVTEDTTLPILADYCHERF